jgi:transposase
MTSLGHPEQPILIDVREGTNDQWDFFAFVVEAVRVGHLKQGDYLVVDNASIHGAEDSWPILRDFLDAAGIEILYLPCYSPELNPCEFVFSYIKTKLRFHRDITNGLIFDILRAIASISFDHLFGCYIHCFSQSRFVYSFISSKSLLFYFIHHFI